MRRKYGFCIGPQLSQIPRLSRPADIVDHPMCQTCIGLIPPRGDAGPAVHALARHIAQGASF